MAPPERQLEIRAGIGRGNVAKHGGFLTMDGSIVATIVCPSKRHRTALDNKRLVFYVI